MKDQNEQQRSYFIEADLMELGRQLLQSCVISQELGGLFPKHQDLCGVRDVLDLACGAGGWTLEVADAHAQQMRVTGVDVDPVVLEYARARVWANEIPNAGFMVMDITQPLQFEANSFDFIHGRFLVGFMHREDWPKLIAECRRVLRPGGTLLLVEGDTWVASQSPAIAKISRYLYQALWLSGQAFCADGTWIGVSPMLGLFLEEAGYEQVDTRGCAINTSYGARAYSMMMQDTILLAKHLQPFLEEHGVAEAQELDKLYHQGMEEIRRKSYRSLWYITQTSGRKPFR